MSMSVAELVHPVRGRLIAGVALQAAATLAGLVPYVCVAEIGRTLLAPGATDHDRAWTLVALAVGALLLRFTLLGAATTVTHLADADLTYALRRRIADHLSRVPLGWFGRRSSGQVRHAVQDDVAALHTLVAHAGNDLTTAAVTPVAVLAYLAVVDWRLTLLTLIPVVLFAAIYAWVMRGSRDMADRYADAQGRIAAAAVEFVHGIAEVKAFGQVRRAHARFTREVDGFAEAFASWVQPVMRGFAVAVAVISGPSMLLTIALAGTWFVAQGWVEPPDLLPFFLLGIGLTAPFSTLRESGYSMQLAQRAAERIGTLLSVAPLPTAATPVAPDGTDVRLERVGFSYDGERDVLRDVDLTLAPGTVTALVGPSGAGKSTLATLVPRFVDVTHGRVLIGGVDVREIDPRVLYRQVGFVFQQVDLLRTSVRDNIALARPDASDVDVEAAARAAQIHDRIVTLPRGYASVIGEDARLSGGEAQRVSIARALLADAPILVLDEATAHADPESESAIQDALSRLVVGRTLLVIAHRLATIADADRIVVLDGGRVVEQGRHVELVAAGGWYARAWATERRTDATATGAVR